MNNQYENIELGNLLFGHSRGEYPVERGVLQDIFADFFRENHIDGYGYPEEDSVLFDTDNHEDDIISCETDTFLIRPYYWGDEEKYMDLPNFVYKPDGLTISWYKYPLRDSYSSTPITEEYLRKILRDCTESVKRL